MLKSTFPEFLKEELRYNKTLCYGLTADSVSIKDAVGNVLYTLTVTQDEITISQLKAKNRQMDEQLEKFVHSCLL